MGPGVIAIIVYVKAIIIRTIEGGYKPSLGLFNGEWRKGELYD
jgi:hypothetical protein